MAGAKLYKIKCNTYSEETEDMLGDVEESEGEEDFEEEQTPDPIVSSLLDDLCVPKILSLLWPAASSQANANHTDKFLLSTHSVTPWWFWDM